MGISRVILKDFEGSNDHGRTLEASPSERFIAVNYKGKYIGIVNLDIKENGSYKLDLIPESNVETLSGENDLIVDHKIWNKSNYSPTHYIMSVITKNGKLGIFSSEDKGKKWELIINNNVLLEEGRKETCKTLVVCPKYLYFTVYLENNKGVASRILIYEFISYKTSLRFSTEIDLIDQNISFSRGLDFFGYFEEEKFLILTAITFIHDYSEFVTFIYDTVNNKMREAKDFRKKVKGVKKPGNFVKFGNEMVGIDENANLVSVKYIFN